MGTTHLPQYFPSDPADFHAELFDRLRDLHLRRNAKEAIIAPREGAKSTVITLAYVLYCALERHEPFTLILSDSAGQAQSSSATSATNSRPTTTSPVITPTLLAKDRCGARTASNCVTVP